MMQAQNRAKRMPVHKVVVMGDGGVGKTCLTTQFILRIYADVYDPTGGDDYRKQLVVDGETCIIEILDTAGHEEYTALREQWMREGEGFLLVYSITSRFAFERIKGFHDQILKVKKDNPPPIVLVGNKCDLATSPAREVSTEEGQALAKELGVRKFFETSAKTPVHVDEAFEEAVKGIQAAKRAEQESLETEKRERAEKAKQEQKRREKAERSIQNRLSRFIAKLKSSK